MCDHNKREDNDMTQKEFLDEMAKNLTTFFKVPVGYSKMDTKVISYPEPQPDNRQHLLMYVLKLPKGDLTASLWFGGEAGREFPDHWADMQSQVAAREIIRLGLAHPDKIRYKEAKP
jgi:hypothetical protein